MGSFCNYTLLPVRISSTASSTIGLSRNYSPLMFATCSSFVLVISEMPLLRRLPDPWAPPPVSRLPAMKPHNAQYAKSPSLTNQSRKETKKEAL
jgi:hypothetical protein